MPRPCVTCQHPKRAAIDAALATTTPLTRIAATHRIPEATLRSHRDRCLPRAVALAVSAQKEQRIATGLSTLDEVRSLIARGHELVELAFGKRDPQTGKLTRQRFPGDDGADIKSAAVALTAVLRALDSKAKLTGEIQPGSSTVNVLVDARGKPREEWAQVLGAILDALRPYPDAARAVANALRQVEAPALALQEIAPEGEERIER